MKPAQPAAPSITGSASAPQQWACLTLGTSKHLLQRVRSGDIQYARKLTHTRTLIVLEHAGHELAFIYSSREKRILSFLSAPVLAALRSELDAGQARP